MDPLDLKRLPRVGASDGFTEAVLRRVRAAETRRPAPRLRLAAAAAAVVVVSAAAGAWWTRQSAPAEPATVISAESIEQLRSEYRELNREFESLRGLAEDTQPFVPVSIDPETQLLFDLRDIEPLTVRYAAADSRRIHQEIPP